MLCWRLIGPWMAATAAATEPMPATCPVKGMYSGGAVTWEGEYAHSGVLAKDGLGARLGLGALGRPVVF